VKQAGPKKRESSGMRDKFVGIVAILANGCSRILQTMVGVVNLCSKVV